MHRISMLLPAATALLAVSVFCAAPTASAAVNRLDPQVTATELGTAVSGTAAPCPEGYVCLYRPDGPAERWYSSGCRGLSGFTGTWTLVNNSEAVVRLYSSVGCAGTPVKEIPPGSEADIDLTDINSIEIVS